MREGTNRANDFNTRHCESASRSRLPLCRGPHRVRSDAHTHRNTNAHGNSTPTPVPSPAFTQIVLFGDSLSDTGNVRNRTNAKTGGAIDYPSHTFNYSNGRFTNDNATDPSSNTYAGVWHEQLALTFPGLPAATYSLGGGTNYAFGGATTNDGTHQETAVSTPFRRRHHHGR